MGKPLIVSNPLKQFNDIYDMDYEEDDETVNEKTLYKTYKDGLLTIKWANKN